MAELAPDPSDRATRDADPVTHSGASADRSDVPALRARIAELEALLAARTHTIVGLGARLAELQGDAPPPLTGRVRALEHELEQLRATKVLRWSAIPRRVYARVRRG